MKDRFQSHSKQDLIVEVWEHLGRQVVGGSVLKQIQRTLVDRLGANSWESPAAIARTLVDAGADLRHPEVLEYDATWREAESQKEFVNDPGVLFDLENGWSLKTAASWINELEGLRKEGNPFAKHMP